MDLSITDFFTRAKQVKRIEISDQHRAFFCFFILKPTFVFFFCSAWLLKRNICMLFDPSQWVQITFTERKTNEIEEPKKKHKTKAKA
ncbi:hypothetical protein Bca101_036327 [Brassica carinata]